MFIYFLSHCSLWLVVDFFVLIEFLCQAGYVNGNPSGSCSENRSKSFLEEWVFVSGGSSDSPFLERLELLFSSDEILCGYEDIVSSGTEHFTAWVKVSPHEVLVQHMVDIQKATADFREASQRKPATSSHTNSVNKHFATRSIVQKRLSIYNWNPGP